jgi:hypothetical protein
MKYVLMYEKGVMRPAETILRRWGGGIKECDGRSESKIYCKHFGKCHNVPPIQ